MGTVLNGTITQLTVIIVHLSENETAVTAVSKLCLFTRFVEISNIVKYVKSTLLDIVKLAHNNALNLYLFRSHFAFA